MNPRATTGSPLQAHLGPATAAPVGSDLRLTDSQPSRGVESAGQQVSAVGSATRNATEPRRKDVRAATCAVCGETFEIAARDFTDTRPLFCGMRCFRVARDAETAARSEAARLRAKERRTDEEEA